MVFSGIPFLFFFFPLFMILYYVAPKSIKNYVLLAFSLIFYAWGEPIYIILMLLSTALNYAAGLLFANKGHKKSYLVITVAINLLLLGFFKYTDMFIGTFNSLTGLSVPFFNLTLPIGISFYTFQTMSYSIDVYRGDTPAQKNYFLLLTYVCMFPQLIAGPIVRYSEICKELGERTVTVSDFGEGLLYMMRGLFKKVLLANTLGYLFSTVSAMNVADISAGTAWLGILAFNFQIYFDFSGYSDMAIGMGQMMGFKFPQNFNHPFAARSVSDFWRRWHMTLTGWFRDYVYIPLGGNRVATSKHICNILIVWTLTGIWHGASWNFLFWGLYFGVILLLEKFVYGRYIESLPTLLRIFYTMFIVVCGWVLFAFDDFSVGAAYLSTMFTGRIFDETFIYYLYNYIILFAVALICSMPIRSRIGAFFKDKPTVLQNVYKITKGILYVVLFVLSVAMLVSDTYNPFLYFRF